MPTYEYRCPAGHEFEHFFRTMSSAEVTMQCPVCGEVGERKVSGGSALLFKGSGFYITDYGKDGKKDQRKSSAKPEGGGSSGEGGSGGGGSGGGGSGGEGSGGGESRKSSDKPSGGSGGSE
jgi:putative FmdB family regulatory protein